MDFEAKTIQVSIAGKSNPAGLKRDLFYTSLDQVVAIPLLDTQSNSIGIALGMRPAVTANPNATPPIAEVKAGKFAQISASEMDSDFKCEPLGEGDNHAGFKVMVKAFINGKDGKASYLLGQLRNRRLILIVTEKDGTRYLINDITLKYGSQVNPKRGYSLEGEVILSEEPPIYLGPIAL